LLRGNPWKRNVEKMKKFGSSFPGRSIVGAGRAAVLLLSLLFAGTLTACQATSPVTARAMVRQRSMLDLSGLNPVETVEQVKASIAVPRQWTEDKAKSGLFYVHQQWRSPSGATTVGVVYLRLPIPLSADTIADMAKKKYTKKGEGGEILAQWIDRFGRHWFEGQNDKYHGRGFVMVDGTTAWAAYVGYERRRPLEPLDLALGERALESVLPRGVLLAARKPD
jgi:hypothetical protein